MMDEKSRDTMNNRLVIGERKNREINVAKPLATNSRPPILWVLSQACFELSVQGVRIPNVKFCRTLPIRLPSNNRSAPPSAAPPLIGLINVS